MPYQQHRYFTPTALEYGGGSVIAVPEGWDVVRDGDGWWFSGDEPGVGLFVRNEFRHLPNATAETVASQAADLVAQVERYLHGQRLIEPIRRFRNGSARIIEAVIEFDEPDGRTTRAFRWYVLAAAGRIVGACRFFLNMPPSRAADPDMQELIEIIAPQPFRVLATPADLPDPEGESVAAADPWAKLDQDDRWQSHFTALVRHVFGDSIELNIPRRWACEPPDEESQSLRCFDRAGGPGAFWVSWTKPPQDTAAEAIERIRRNAQNDPLIIEAVAADLGTKAILTTRQLHFGDDEPERFHTYGWIVAYDTSLGPFIVVYSLIIPEALIDDRDFQELRRVLDCEIRKTELHPTKDAIMRSMDE